MFTPSLCIFGNKWHLKFFTWRAGWMPSCCWIINSSTDYDRFFFHLHLENNLLVLSDGNLFLLSSIPIAFVLDWCDALYSGPHLKSGESNSSDPMGPKPCPIPFLPTYWTVQGRHCVLRSHWSAGAGTTCGVKPRPCIWGQFSETQGQRKGWMMELHGPDPALRWPGLRYLLHTVPTPAWVWHIWPV